MNNPNEAPAGVSIDIEWDTPDFGMYNGYYSQGLPTRISNGRRTFIVKFSGDFAGTNSNLSIRYDGEWVIMSKKNQDLKISEVFEVFEAHLQIYPNLVPKLRIIDQK